MSFILDALKKSEQERALGRVPRIAANVLLEEPTAARQPHWVGLAVLLALLAVGLALYGLLREPRPAQVSAPPVPAPSRAAPGTPPASLPAGPGELVGEPLAVSEGRTALLRYGPVAPGAEPPSPPSPPAQTKDTARLDTSAGKAGIPPDLIEDIAAFKDAVRQERLGSPGDGEARPPAGSRTSDPRQRRLPAELLERLPAYLLTAHVYDALPARRFVVINALRYREGERTRTGLVVEEILPDGVLLAFEGQRFFHRR